MIRFKPGASLEGVQPETLEAIAVAARVYAKHGIDTLVVTSGTDGKHMVGSLHYKGLAVDLRTRNIDPYVLHLIMRDLQKELAPRGYDVIFESTHYHIEFDPKPRKES
jgi:hypothetical protein